MLARPRKARRSAEKTERPTIHCVYYVAIPTTSAQIKRSPAPRRAVATNSPHVPEAAATKSPKLTSRAQRPASGSAAARAAKASAHGGHGAVISGDRACRSASCSAASRRRESGANCRGNPHIHTETTAVCTIGGPDGLAESWRRRFESDTCLERTGGSSGGRNTSYVGLGGAARPIGLAAV